MITDPHNRDVSLGVWNIWNVSDINTTVGKYLNAQVVTPAKLQSLTAKHAEKQSSGSVVHMCFITHLALRF